MDRFSLSIGDIIHSAKTTGILYMKLPNHCVVQDSNHKLVIVFYEDITFVTVKMKVIKDDWVLVKESDIFE